MATLSSLVHDGRVNAALGWACLLALLGVAGVEALGGRLLYAGFALAVLAAGVVPPAVARDPTAMLPWELLALALLPAVARTLGLFVAEANYVSVAAVALVVAVELSAFTGVEMTARFAVAFVVLTTMAVAAVWAVAQYASDAYLGTDLVAGTTALQWELAAASAVGVAAGLLFAAYFREVGVVAHGEGAT